MSYVVAAYFVAKPAHREDFRKAIVENATAPWLQSKNVVVYNRILPLAPGA